MLYFRTLVDTVYSLKDQVKALEQVSTIYTEVHLIQHYVLVTSDRSVVCSGYSGFLHQ
jgi:hypothetical protein